jgi:dihydrofolate reductase
VALLHYSAIMSVDGFVADSDGAFHWAMPDEEVHAFVNDLERSVGTYLYGRRMYETMRYWADVPDLENEPAVIVEFADLWQRAEKVVYSTTLDDVDTSRTRLERVFDPAAIARMKATAEADLSVGGPGLASHCLAAGLVDELHLLVAPVVVGSGRHFLQGDHRLQLGLEEARRFANGMTYLRYRVHR